ncbi:MAG TPA: trigger factor [Solirubrobacteraceae bacterium]
MPAVSDRLTTSVTELPESRARVDVTVSPQELEKRMGETARRLAQNMRVPGFRKGKVPPPVVIRQLGREVVLDETVRGQLGVWYVDAIEQAGLHTVGEPDLDLGDLPAQGEPLAFAFEIGVRPPAKLGEYKGVEVGKREPEADPERVDAELAQLRERMARLETKEGAAQQGDYVVMDYVGSIDGTEFDGGSGRDQLLELGSSTLIPGFEEQLQGASAGDEVTVNVTFPEDYNAEHLAGKEAQFAVTVKEVKEKLLPDLDDDFAADAAGFDTLDELREDIATRQREAQEQQIEAEFREAVVDAVAANATIELPDTLVEGRAKELWERMLHTLGHQGISREAYLQISGRSEEEILADAKPDAAQALRREAVLEAVVEAEGIEPSDGDMLDALQASAARENTTPEKLRERLEKRGRLDELKADIAQRQAVDFLAENAKAISVEQAKAKKLLWTPDEAEREADGAEAGGRGKLWTPGS